MELNHQFLGKMLVKFGLGVVGGALAGPYAPLGGAAGYALGEYIFDEDKESLDPEDLAVKYATKLFILTAGGVAGGMASEALGRSVGTVWGLVTEAIPGDVSSTVAEGLHSQLCKLIENPCVSGKIKEAAERIFYENVYILIFDEVIDETIGREAAKFAGNQLTQKLLQNAPRRGLRDMALIQANF